jgi:predicted MFS family arabinose efflux permease
VHCHGTRVTAPSSVGGRSGIVVTAFALSATGILANTLVLPVLPDLARDLGISSGGAGLVVAMASLPGVVVAPLIGLLADRYGRRAVVMPCLVVFGAAGMAGGAAPDFATMLVLRFVQGVGAAGLVNLAVVILGDSFTGARRARMIGLNAVAITMGLAVFPTLGGGIGDLFGWRASFLPYGGAFLVAALAARTLPPGRPAASRTMREQIVGAAAYVRDRRVAAMAVAGFASFVLIFGVSVTLPIHLDEQFGSTAVVRGLMLALPAVGAGVVSLLMGRLAQRWGAWDMVPVGFALLGVAYAGVAGSPVIAVVALPAVAYGVGEALTVVPLQDFATAIAPDEHRGMIVAVWVSAVRAGQFAGPALAGLSIAAIGTGGTFVAGTGLAALAAGVAFAARPSLRLQGSAVRAR